MYHNKKIGVVILNYNDSDTTLCLCNIIKAYSVIDIIVVVDNLSTNNSYKILKKIEDNKVKVIQTDKNGGYSYGNNFGAFYLIKKYNIDILAIANPDVEFTEIFLKTLIDNLINENAACACGMMEGLDGVVSDVNGNITSENDYLKALLSCTITGPRILKYLQRNKKKCFRDIVEIDTIIGPLFIIDAKVFVKIQGFDTGVFLYYEESILGAKLKKFGYKTIINTNIKFLHKESVTINKNVNYIRKRKIMFDSMKYYFKNYTNINTLQYFILKLFIEYGYFARKILFKIFRLIKA